MAYRVLYIEKSNNLKLYLDNLKISTNKGELFFSINDIQILVIDNYKSVLTIPLINRLTESNVCTIICGIDHLPKSYILPMNGHFSQSGNIEKQINWDKNIKGVIQQCIVKAKIYNQLIILKENNKNTDVIIKLTNYLQEVKLFDSTNREGISAKLYFKAMFGNHFIRFDEDIINSGLNYGYAIFRALISSIIVSKGFLPNLGFFHIGKSNMFNLSDDIIEVFRPIVDNYVYNNLINEVIFKSIHRDELIKLTTKKVMFYNKYQTIPNAINLYIESILKVLATNEKKYFVFPSPLYIENDI